MPTSIAITTIISEEDIEYSIQRAGWIPRVRLRSYQACGRAEASAGAIAEMSKNAATSGTIRTRTSSSGTAMSRFVAVFMRRNEPVTGSENELASARIPSGWMRCRTESPAFQRHNVRSRPASAACGWVSVVTVALQSVARRPPREATACGIREWVSAGDQHLVDDVDHAV